jgi:hypothetical protein
LKKRKTNLKVIWQRAKIRRLLLLFTFQAIGFSVVIFSITLLLQSLKDSFPQVNDIETIRSNGSTLDAVLVNIENIENINVNGHNPQILSYEFVVNGKAMKSRFSVFEPEKTKNLVDGQKIPIVYLSGKSVPKDLEQYSFNMDFMFYIAVVVLLIGALLFYILFTRVRQEIELYQTGIIENGKIVSISRNQKLTLSIFNKSWDIHYKYQGKIFKSRTNNKALTNNKSLDDDVRILVSKDGESSCLYPELISIQQEWEPITLPNNVYNS